ncbi:peptidoglycan D,D-transpeptidase FtsI family protein [Oceanobacillus alkalisoli]|uniref:peptidoglycan D,D-transpeptidase FtsI family protein n=1 Tax=Oceanobacillus alkalisoli TaxID=2925113 RepID=UPI001EEFA682|nr:penicillin-binding protein 2 [Oceanobacillus alkalisoli]MCF3941778.1 penicillin-binding protein 2 [Oceanobacillus alkalisoli]MCG5103058.1 penicillin-binding protein 2 [Oceanobacillus alkalisoli]
MKEKKKKRAQLPFRTNIIFFIVFLLFSMLIFQLGVVQILNGEAFQDKIDQTIQDTTKIAVPRGKIYDTNENLVVDNKALYSITYTPPKGVQAQDRLDLAEKLAQFISMDSDEELDKVSDRDKREYVYLKDLTKNEGKSDDEEKEKTYEELLPEEELKDKSNAEIYQLVLDSIPDDHVADSVFSTQELEVIRIKKELDKAYSLTPQIVKNEDVTPEEYALVSENLDQLRGINATTDWNRDYLYDSTIRSLLGSISTHQTGIPAENMQYFMSRGYSRNDRVGRSGLEEQYEDVLRGRKEQIEYTTTKTGAVIDSKTIVQGKRGKDLILTIDMEFQEKVDEILEDELGKAIRLDPYNNRFLNDALAVVMNPQTGELISVAGKTYDHKEGTFSNSPHRTLHDAHLPGSVVKGATVLAGLHSGVISPGQTFLDRPIKIAGTPEKRSLSSTIGYADDIKALKESSNVYMFYIALRMGGDYRYRFPNGASSTMDPAAWQEMSNYFLQFGLGAPTGIDFPFESTGFPIDTAPNMGLFMDYAIGQYGTYTTMQLAQYVSTIANDGYRVQPHFVKEIREPIASQTELGPLYKSINTEYLNQIQASESEIARVQEGFRQAFQVQRGTAYSYFAGKDYQAVGKTGTAESRVVVDGVGYDTINRAIIGYAPMDNPEVAFAVMVPNIGLNAREDGNIANRIAERIMDTYFDMQEDQDEEADEEESQ